MATRKTSTIVRITDEHRQWIDQMRMELGGLSRDSFVRFLVADAMAQWDADEPPWKRRSTRGQQERAGRPPAGGDDGGGGGGGQGMR